MGIYLWDASVGQVYCRRHSVGVKWLSVKINDLFCRPNRALYTLDQYNRPTLEFPGNEERPLSCSRVQTHYRQVFTPCMTRLLARGHSYKVEDKTACHNWLTFIIAKYVSSCRIRAKAWITRQWHEGSDHTWVELLRPINPPGHGTMLCNEHFHDYKFSSTTTHPMQCLFSCFNTIATHIICRPAPGA